MDNERQVLLEMCAPLDDGEPNEVDVIWQATYVCRPLLPVSKVCDKGQHVVTFDAEPLLPAEPKEEAAAL